jgi:hypothetical protein
LSAGTLDFLDAAADVERLLGQLVEQRDGRNRRTTQTFTLETVAAGWWSSPGPNATGARDRSLASTPARRRSLREPRFGPGSRPRAFFITPGDTLYRLRFTAGQ